MTIEDLIDRHATQREQIVQMVTSQLLRSWVSLGQWNRADIEAFASRVVPVVQAGQLRTAHTVDLYVAQVLTLLKGQAVSPVGISPDEMSNLRGVTPKDVYTRPAIRLWKDLKDGVSWDDAQSAAQARIGELVDDDMSLAYRHASKAVMSRQSGVTGYRRIIRPELSRGGSCPLCQTASQNVYHRKDLLPIHTHCRCGVIPVIGSKDPGRDLNEADVTEAPVATVTHIHGELGPVLYPAGQHFTGPSQIEAAL